MARNRFKGWFCCGLTYDIPHPIAACLPEQLSIMDFSPRLAPHEFVAVNGGGEVEQGDRGSISSVDENLR
jgi:hypothetical protein